MPSSIPGRVRALALATAALVAVGLLGTLPARADTAPQGGQVATVSTDPLPTVQIDGVVWSQVVVGSTVYVGGSFSTARPAGAAAGSNTTPRANVLAFNLTTGALLSGFVANTNAEVRSITAAPDGSRIYIAGSFTSVNGTTRNRLAALNPTTGAVISGFAPSFNSTVEAVKATASTVYAGGGFTAVSGQTRTRGAAVAASNGAVQPFAPVIEGGRARALVLSPDGGRVVFGGSFTTINGSGNPGYGLGAVNAATGALVPWNANSQVRNGGTDAAIWSLSSDGDSVFGSGYHYGGGGNLEGWFRASWTNGDLVWVADCHGDTYSTFPYNGAVYIAGHAHYCANIGGFPQTDPNWTYQRGMATTKAWNGNRNGGQTLGYPSWQGVAAPDLLNWWPDFNTGTASGAGQGPWSVTAGGNYVVYGGEFTRVNNQPQQGLVRFAVSSVAPNKDGPRLSGSGFVPTLSSPPRARCGSAGWRTTTATTSSSPTGSSGTATPRLRSPRPLSGRASGSTGRPRPTRTADCPRARTATVFGPMTPSATACGATPCRSPSRAAPATPRPPPPSRTPSATSRRRSRRPRRTPTAASPPPPGSSATEPPGAGPASATPTPPRAPGR
ncbi:delta-60 repeat domain-containing protein [Naasia aerilata]|uniref:Uncharacterized protein n=1 Tax=Naasia aerilata TaxID=1162966 RepID=A0ABN6XHF1_9MICO|nr:hypothetical protein GCM10025866_02470 [Naasia aerilata]